MCFLTNYIYKCGHEEEETYKTCQTYIDAGFCCDEFNQQNVIMQDKCSSCRLRVVRTNYLYQCGHEEQELERRQLCIDAGFCCDEHEEQNVVMPDVCVACKLAAKRAGVEKQSDEAEIAGCEERKGDERSLQWE